MRNDINLTERYWVKDFPTTAHMLSVAFTQLVEWIDEFAPTSWGYVDIPEYAGSSATSRAGVEIWAQSRNDSNDTRD